ncbi:MAG: N-ethylammeline chlorohydrolase, partial [Deltaproteobacteria bacterium]
RYGYAPRFVLSCTDALLREVARDAAERGLWVHTHASENVDELALVRARSGGPGNVAHLASLGVRGPRTVLAHCIHLDPDEVDALAGDGTRVAHCVSSNLKLGSGVADVPGLVAAGVHVSLGADGAPCNNRLDAFTEMRTAALVQKPRHGPTAMPARDVLRMATRGGAEVLGRGDTLGQVRPGFLADLQVVDLRAIGVGPGGGVASRLVYAAGPQHVRHVWVDGHRLVADGRLVRRDHARVVAAAEEALSRLLGRAHLAGADVGGG